MVPGFETLESFSKTPCKPILLEKDWEIHCRCGTKMVVPGHQLCRNSRLKKISCPGCGEPFSEAYMRRVLCLYWEMEKALSMLKRLGISIYPPVLEPLENLDDSALEEWLKNCLKTP